MGEILVQSWSLAPPHSIIEYTSIYLFIILVSGLLGCFQFAAILNNAVVAILFFMSPGTKRPGFPRAGASSLFSVQFNCSVMSDSLQPHGLQHADLPVHHQLPEFTQTHVHWAIQPSHPLSCPSPTFNLSQHQGLFQWVNSSHQVTKVLEFQLQHQSFQWIFRTNFF